MTRAQWVDASGHAVLLNPKDSLELNGPLLAVEISLPHQLEQDYKLATQSARAPVSGKAILDTGANSSCVDQGVCKALGLQPVDHVILGHAGGQSVHPCFSVTLGFTDFFMRPIELRRARGANLQYVGKGIIAILGRDLLSRMRFVYNGPIGRFEISVD